MNIEIENKQKEKQFEPVEIKLTVETIQELRLLFHVFNKINLYESIFFDSKYDINQTYSDDLIETFSIGPGVIKREIERQGFKV